MVDITNAFIQQRVQQKKDMTIINIRGVLVDIILEIVPDIYEPYETTYQKGVKQLVVQFQNYIYGKIMESLLYYQKLRKSLELEGHEFDP